MSESPEFQMNAVTRASAESLIDAALQEDLNSLSDLTSEAMIPMESQATVDIVSRQRGFVCGTELIALTYQRLGSAVDVEVRMGDGKVVGSGDIVASITGPVRSLLTGERTVLNLLSHLSGVASKTGMFVERVRHCRAVILDTRKTLPGYRYLQKYAVTCGGGQNHRMGLYDGILIKDNHLAARAGQRPSDAVTDARQFLKNRSSTEIPVEIEVDSLAQLKDALNAHPDIVLLDNMTTVQLREAVALRDAVSPETQLEASGGVSLDSVASIAETGVDRISVGGLTHSAAALDLGFDWPSALRQDAENSAC